MDEKVIRVKGVLGAKFRPLRRENIIANVDPDVIVKSRILAEAENYSKLQIFRSYVQMIAQDPTINLRYAEKKLGKLSGLKQDEINQIFPKTIDELLAEEENDKLEANDLAMVSADDNHQTHLEIHNKLSDTAAKYAHIQAHKRAMLIIKQNPNLVPPTMNEMNPTGGAGVGEEPMTISKNPNMPTI